MTLQQLRYIIKIADCGSMNEAAKQLFMSQPSLSLTVKELEAEIGIDVFLRTNRGITITPKGEEFLGYARQITQQYDLIENRFIYKHVKKVFSVSMQHYTFAVKAFVETVKAVGMDEFEFSVYETKTGEVIDNVRNFKSELGVIYLNDFNKKALTKILSENSLEFTELFTCDTYVYLWAGHPLADKKQITMKMLEDYPCVAFDQGKNNSFYFSEEMKSTYQYKKIIKANDRATVLNLMVGLNGYTLCSGILSEELNGDSYKAVPLAESEKMRIGFIKRKGATVSSIGQIYLSELEKYKKNVL